MEARDRPLGRQGAAVDTDRQLVVDQRAAAPRQDRRTLGETRALLLAVAGGESSNPTPVRVDAPADLGPAGADGLTRDPLTEGIWRSNEARADRCLSDALKWRGAHSVRAGKSSRGQTSRARRMRRNNFPLRVVRGRRLGLITVSQNGNPGLNRSDLCTSGPAKYGSGHLAKNTGRGPAFNGRGSEKGGRTETFHGFGFRMLVG
jgi:hypothetical protein